MTDTVAQPDTNNGEQTTTTGDVPSDVPSTEAGNPNENELILIQDNAFTVKIHVPGLEPFDLQVQL